MKEEATSAKRYPILFVGTHSSGTFQMHMPAVSAACKLTTDSVHRVTCLRPQSHVLITVKQHFWTDCDIISML